jgi:hypothetical protein
MNKKYDNNNIIIASRAYFLHSVLLWSKSFRLFFIIILGIFFCHGLGLISLTPNEFSKSRNMSMVLLYATRNSWLLKV